MPMLSFLFFSMSFCCIPYKDSEGRQLKDLLEERTACVAEFPMRFHHIWFKHFIFILSLFYAGFMLIIPRGH